MNKKPLALIVFLAVADTASARIGETYEQCIIRYGPPVQELKGDRAEFKKGLFQITVLFSNGVVGRISFKKVAGIAIEKEEITVLLKANATDGKDWKELPRKATSIGNEKELESDAGDRATLLTNYLSIDSAAFTAFQKLPISKQMEGF